MEYYFFEVTDTYGAEANYSWVRRFKIAAKSNRAAVRKFNKSEGFTGSLRKQWDSGDTIRYDVQGACICVFMSFMTEDDFNDSDLKLIN